jgi:hypothetical protein
VEDVAPRDERKEESKGKGSLNPFDPSCPPFFSFFLPSILIYIEGYSKSLYILTKITAKFYISVSRYTPSIICVMPHVFYQNSAAGKRETYSTK